MSENRRHHWHRGNGGHGGHYAPGVGTFTQEQVSAIAAKEAKAARAKAQTDLLASLGVSSADDLKAALDGFKAHQESQKSAEQKAAELASQVDTFKSQAETYKATVQGLLDAEVAAIPEDKRSIVPDFGDPAKSLAWIASNRALIGSGTAAPVVNVGTGNSPGAQGAHSNRHHGAVQQDELRRERMQFYADFPEQAADMSAKFAATIAT
jgi:hypothetical protein